MYVEVIDDETEEDFLGLERTLNALKLKSDIVTVKSSIEALNADDESDKTT